MQLKQKLARSTALMDCGAALSHAAPPQFLSGSSKSKFSRLVLMVTASRVLLRLWVEPVVCGNLYLVWRPHAFTYGKFNIFSRRATPATRPPGSLQMLWNERPCGTFTCEMQQPLKGMCKSPFKHGQGELNICIEPFPRRTWRASCMSVVPCTSQKALRCSQRLGCVGPGGCTLYRSMDSLVTAVLASTKREKDLGH